MGKGEKTASKKTRSLPPSWGWRSAASRRRFGVQLGERSADCGGEKRGASGTRQRKGAPIPSRATREGTPAAAGTNRASPGPLNGRATEIQQVKLFPARGSRTEERIACWISARGEAVKDNRSRLSASLRRARRYSSRSLLRVTVLASSLRELVASNLRATEEKDGANFSPSFFFAISCVCLKCISPFKACAHVRLK